MARGSSSLPGRTAKAGPRGAREAPDSLARSFSRRPTSRSPSLDEPAPGDSDIASGRDRVQLSPGRLDPPGPASRLRAAHPLRGHPEVLSPDHVGRADKSRRGLDRHDVRSTRSTAREDRRYADRGDDVRAIPGSVTGPIVGRLPTRRSMSSLLPRAAPASKRGLPYGCEGPPASRAVRGAAHTGDVRSEPRAHAGPARERPSKHPTERPGA